MRLSWVIAIFSAGAIFAQPSGTRLAYEAASLKLNTSGAAHSDTDGTRGQIIFKNTPLESLLEIAYSVGPHRVIGPAWMESVRLDIAAKYPADTSESDGRLMLRNLLEERFHLATHPETREIQGYGLVVAKGGFRLKPVEPHGDDTSSSGGRVRTLVAKSTSIAFLANLVARYVDGPVTDQTGLAGVYDFELRWTRDGLSAESAESSDQVPNIFGALQETPGLRLQAQKVPVEVVVVDRVERVPTEN